MADYVPDTIVKVLKDVPLDDTYTDTRWFDNKASQQAFFNGKVKYTFTDMTYQRVNNSVANPRVPLTCRVPMIADNLYDCNYMMFQNTNYGTKWFYAFIRQVNYINPNNTEIVYEIDYLQTFITDFQIKASFVEREHASAAEDVIGNNTAPEPISVSEWTTDAYWHEYVKPDVQNYIRISVVPNSIISALITRKAQIYNGVYSGADYHFFTDADTANTFIGTYAALDQCSAIVDVSMVNNYQGWDAREVVPKTTQTTLAPTDANDFRPKLGETYISRNKKLGTGQFTYYEASCGGSTATWLPEMFFGNRVTVTMWGISAPTNEVMFVPNYLGRAGNTKEDITFLREYSVSCDFSIRCTWADMGYISDAVKEGLKLTAFAVGKLGHFKMADKLGASAMRTTRMFGNESVFPKMAKQISEGKNVKSQVESIAELIGGVSGTQHGGESRSSAAMYYATDRTGLEITKKIPSLEDLKRIDQFFDMFGYQVNKVKVPNLKTRQSWNYVKLNSPCIYGSVPVEGMAIIKAAFSHGIRLWHVDAVGDYSIENPAL